MLPEAVSSVAGRACTCSSRWVRRSTVSMSRVASLWPFPAWPSRALRRRSSWRQLSSRLLMRSRLSGSRGLSVPGLRRQSGQMQARIADHGRGGIQLGLPVPGGGHVLDGGRGGRHGLVILDRQQEQVVRSRGGRCRGLVGQGEGLRRFGAVFRQVRAFFDKVRQFDDLVLLGRCGHGRLSCRMVGDPVPQRLALHSSSCSKRQTAKKKSRGFPRLAMRKWMTAYGWHLDLAQPVRSFFRSGFSATTLT